jgi:hypothetical protein
MSRFAPASSQPLLWRVPSILAVYGASVCIWLMARIHMSPLVAILSLGLVLSLGLFQFAVLARQYALLSFCLAAALLLWSGFEQTTRPLLRSFGLWLVLTLCLSLHFYGLIEVATIGLAELIWALSRRRIRLPIWLSLFATAPIEAALFPLATHLAKINSGDSGSGAYYGKPTVGRFLHAAFDVLIGGKHGVLLLVAALLVIAAVHLPGLRRRLQHDSPTDVEKRYSSFEIAITALACLPAMVFGLSLITHSFSMRYMAPGMLFPAIVAPYLINRSAARRTVALALIPAIAALLLYQSHAPDPPADALRVAQTGSVHAPIVVAEGGLYIELMQSADAAMRSRLVYLRRPAGTISPDPTNENEVIRLASFHPEYHVSDQAIYLRTHPQFEVLFRPNFSTDTTTGPLIAQGVLAGEPNSQKGAYLLPAKVAMFRTH